MLQCGIAITESLLDEMVLGRYDLITSSAMARIELVAMLTEMFRTISDIFF